MENFPTLIVLMFTATILVGVAQKIHIPYPIALVLGGTAIGFNSYLNPISFDPNLVLVLVLPPLLYTAAFGISYREFRRNLKSIISLALGLVVFTTCVIALLFKWIFPEFPWALAFTFGAIVSPPDAIAATTILKRFAISPRLLTLLEGESLINDASALVLYRLAVTALLSGAFSIAEGGIDFAKIVSVGVLAGFLSGYLLQNFSKRYLEPVVGVVFSFTIPYITYIFTNFLGGSGVLAVVINGLLGARILFSHCSPLRRILGFAAWDIFTILMNCFVFILIGLQLKTLASVMTMQQMELYTVYAVLITLAMIAVRMVWVYVSYAIACKGLNETSVSQNRREAILVGWSGMRGIVSLTAAMALPYTYLDGMPLEGRNEVIFMTFVIIFLTLLIPGLTLPFLIRYLNIPHYSQHHEVIKIKKHLSEVTEESIRRLHVANEINDEELDFLQLYQNLQKSTIKALEHEKMPNFEAVKNLLIQEKRKRMLELWERLEIDDRVLSQLEQELDLEETHQARAELK